ncbi:Sorting nexin, cytoplasm-to-vacuole targeting pathway/endosomal sorting, partial [Cryomyces antarcticus]
PQVFGRFPPTPERLSEQELDPYFVSFESSSRELEALLQGSMEKVNQRTIQHLVNLSDALADMGARYNGFSLSEASPTLATAIEKTGQACDATYIATRDLASTLSASFAEPMRESAQFAGVVRSVLRYRVLKRVQQDMTRSELESKKTTLDSLERSELEAKRIDQYLSSTGVPSSPPKRNLSSSSNTRSSHDTRSRPTPEEDTASIDSDFPPSH